MKLKIVNKSNNPLPKYKTEGSVGMDLMADFSQNEGIEIPRGETVIIPTGIYIEVPAGYEAQIRSRSGLAAKNSVHVLNSPGTIDQDYRGEIKVILHNSSYIEGFTVANGDRIAQMVICPIMRVDLESVESLDETERGEGGLGSTGK